jgi:hypothetical protein
MKHAGPLFALMVAIGFGVFVYTEYTQKGYTQTDREFMDSIISNAYISDEYHARVVDIQNNVTPLSVEDLR